MNCWYFWFKIMSIVSSNELQPEKHLPLYQICDRWQNLHDPFKWNNSREGSRTLNLGNFKSCSIFHIVLSNLWLDTVKISGLFMDQSWLNLQQKLQVSLIDICLQVTDALLYLDLVHCSVSSQGQLRGTGPEEDETTVLVSWD